MQSGKSKASDLSARAPGLAAAAGRLPVTRRELIEEIDNKIARVHAFLKERRLAGLLITSVRNFSWITAGIADNHILITSEAGAASLLVMRDGRKYLIASNSEAPRLAAEDLRGLGYEPKEFKWYEGIGARDKRLSLIKSIARGKQIGTDLPYADLTLVEGGIAKLRYSLTDPEIRKYRWLGRNTAEAVADVCREIEPGVSEREIEAMTCDKLMRRRILPTVLLIGTDRRIYNFRHAPPSAARLKRYAMVNVCARRWGLVAAVTRFVHFGRLPKELKSKLDAVCYVNAHYQASSIPGAVAGEIMERAKTWYAAKGFEGEWERHHQGGATGYAEREWIVHPGSEEVVRPRQALAWNPTIEGAKAEDTIIAYEGHVENITETPDWPVVPTEIDGVTYRSPGILTMRD